MKTAIITTLALAVSFALPVVAQDGTPGAHFIENWDMDEDGQVTVEEATQKRGDLFYMFDQDENGVLDDAEYTLFDETREVDMRLNAGGPGGPMKGVSQAMSREFNDADGDGLVTEQEIQSRVSEWFALMDRDGDDLITSADFGPGRGQGSGN